jgi:hypothetical protein
MRKHKNEERNGGATERQIVLDRRNYRKCKIRNKKDSVTTKYIPNYIDKILFEKLIVAQLLKIFRRTLWNPKFHYRVSKSDTVLCPGSDETSASLPILFKIHSHNILHLHLGLPSSLFYSGFPTRIW